METVKFLIVGDGNVGKTCMLIMFTTNVFPEDYIPTVLDNYTIMSSYQYKPYRMEIWDTAGQEDYAYLRPLSYGHTDVFFVCFSIIDPSSYSNAEKQWYPEVRHHCPRAIIILVGTKKDLRNDEATIEKLRKIGRSPLTPEQGQRMASRIKAHMYLECSALKRIGLKEVFDSGVKAYFERKKKPPKRRVCITL